MLQTYELYLIDEEGARSFLALTCEPTALSARAREEMERAHAAACEIEQFGRPLFGLSAN